jgi:hypothetical protein
VHAVSEIGILRRRGRGYNFRPFSRLDLLVNINLLVGEITVVAVVINGSVVVIVVSDSVVVVVISGGVVACFTIRFGSYRSVRAAVTFLC